jgi:hypothetical protein
MKRTVIGSEVVLWLLLVASVIAIVTSVGLALVYSSEYNFLYVPFASWFVLGLSGLILALAGFAFYLWRRFRKVNQELIDLRKEPLAEEMPVIYGHKYLDKAEFVTIIQSLFRRPPDIKYVHVKPLPGGYGGSTTVLVELQRQQSDRSLPQSFVVKLGDRREMVDEHDKFHSYVFGHLSHAAKFFRHAEWGSVAGIAYEFVGLDPDDEIQSFYQFYQGYAAVEVAELVGEIFSQLGRAWYKNGRIDRSNLYHEYNLLNKKKELIIGRVEEIVDEGDPCRVNFAAVEGRLRPKLRPSFCPDVDIPWHDPVAFLRMWPERNLSVPTCRTVVHGDLHARNILVEIGRDSRKHLWFIDFSHTGNGLSADRTREAIREGIPVDPERGHTLRDFCRLEAEVKFILTRLQDENDLKLAVVFERELMSCGLALYDLPVAAPIDDALIDERFRRAWQVIREIRRQATAYLTNADDLRPYYLSLLNATLPMVYYHPDQFENEASERQQKRYAFISAGMLCSQL